MHFNSFKIEYNNNLIRKETFENVYSMTIQGDKMEIKFRTAKYRNSTYIIPLKDIIAIRPSYFNIELY